MFHLLYSRKLQKKEAKLKAVVSFIDNRKSHLYVEKNESSKDRQTVEQLSGRVAVTADTLERVNSMAGSLRENDALHRDRLRLDNDAGLGVFAQANGLDKAKLLDLMNGFSVTSRVSGCVKVFCPIPNCAATRTNTSCSGKCSR